MSVGQDAILGALSYLALGRETSYGTYTTATAGLNVVSSGLNTKKETQKIEQIETNRVYSEKIGLGRMIEGELEAVYAPENTACNYLLQNAFGGAVSSATATGETVGGTAFEHQFNVGSLKEQTYKSLCANHRKGDSAAGFVFNYNGLRVNELTFACEVDDALRMTAAVIAKDSTSGAGDNAAAIGVVQQKPLSYVDGRLSFETSFAALTSTSYWMVQSFELGMANNLKSESEARRIGSDVLDVLPQGILDLSYKATIRFDTVTAYAAMLNQTQFSSELQFDGDTITGSTLRRMLKFQLPKLFINDAGDPEIGGPDEILSSEVDFAVLRANDTTTGFAIKGFVRNGASAI